MTKAVNVSWNNIHSFIHSFIIAISWTISFINFNFQKNLLQEKKNFRITLHGKLILFEIIMILAVDTYYIKSAMANCKPKVEKEEY